jgi:hypothetical protein
MGCTTIPGSFCGVSGGGVWTFTVARKQGDPLGSETVMDLTLSGVAFYQLRPLSTKPRLRCHGPESIYDIALPKIRVWLARRSAVGVLGD